MMLALILALVVSEPTEFPGVTCGERCIYGTLGSLSQDVTLKEVQDEYSGRSLGSYCSLADLGVILDYFGVHSAPVSVPDKDIGLVPVGSILHLNGAAEHFVIYGGTRAIACRSWLFGFSFALRHHSSSGKLDCRGL